VRYGGISQVYGVVDSTGVVECRIESKGGKDPGTLIGSVNAGFGIYSRGGVSCDQSFIGRSRCL
jgi:hypothetical protein